MSGGNKAFGLIVVYEDILIDQEDFKHKLLKNIRKYSKISKLRSEEGLEQVRVVVAGKYEEDYDRIDSHIGINFKARVTFSERTIRELFTYKEKVPICQLYGETGYWKRILGDLYQINPEISEKPDNADGIDRVKRIQNCKTKQELFESVPLNLVHQAVTVWESKPMSKEDQEYFDAEFKDAKLRDYQQEWLEILKTQSKREILWICDYRGNIGKTWFADWLWYNYNAITIPLNNKDVNYLYKGSEYVYIDVPRRQEEHVSYSSLEILKNGSVVSGKYTGSSYRGRPPKMIIFANFYPERKYMSYDRWVIREYNKEYAPGYRKNKKKLFKYANDNNASDIYCKICQCTEFNITPEGNVSLCCRNCRSTEFTRGLPVKEEQIESIAIEDVTPVIEENIEEKSSSSSESMSNPPSSSNSNEKKYKKVNPSSSSLTSSSSFEQNKREKRRSKSKSNSSSEEIVIENHTLCSCNKKKGILCETKQNNIRLEILYEEDRDKYKKESENLGGREKRKQHREILRIYKYLGINDCRSKLNKLVIQKRGIIEGMCKIMDIEEGYFTVDEIVAYINNRLNDWLGLKLEKQLNNSGDVFTYKPKNHGEIHMAYRNENNTYDYYQLTHEFGNSDAIKKAYKSSRISMI